MHDFLFARFANVLTAITLVNLLAACCTSAVPARADEAHRLQGIWRSLGYGLALEVKGDQFELYELTSISRLRVEQGDFATRKQLAGEVRLHDNGKRFSVLDPTSIAPIMFERVERLPGRNETDEAARPDTRRTFDIVWQTFDDQYAFFQLRGVSWKAQRDIWRAKLEPDASESELFSVLAGLLGTLGDNHVDIVAEPFEFASPGGLPDFPLVHLWRKQHEAASSDADLLSFVRDRYRQHVQATDEAIARQLTGIAQRGADNKLVWGMLQDAIGYLGIREMAGYVDDREADESAYLAALDEALNRAMSDLAKARAMVVDVRFNGGGWDPASVHIANRFADRRRAAFSKKARTRDGFTQPFTIYVEPAGPQQFTRPTLLLTSPMTASAAEIFAYCMKALPHVIHAGLPTMGIHSDMLVRHLPNGWTFSLSNEVYQFVDGKVYEKVGIPPKFEVPMFTSDDLRDGKDQVLLRAIEILKARATDQ